MKISTTRDMTSLNGQMNLFLMAETPEDFLEIAKLRDKLEPVNLSARRLDPLGIDVEFLVIPLDHLVAKKYPIGAQVVFCSKHGESSYTGQTAEVLVYGKGGDESGVAHGIRFEDGVRLWTYPQELSLAPKQRTA